jgi:anti-sigma regulatory factor (Ser/Thr protein kinase)
LQSVELKIGNDPADLALVSQALDRLGEAHSMPTGVLIALQVALDEIVTNVIRYAWPAGGTHDLWVRLAVTDTDVEMTVIDDGIAYDPRRAPAPAPVAPGQRRPPGGVGVHMVKQLVDGFHYERIDGYNRTTLTKRWVVKAADANGREGPNDEPGA